MQVPIRPQALRPVDVCRAACPTTPLNFPLDPLELITTSVLPMCWQRHRQGGVACSAAQGALVRWKSLTDALLHVVRGPPLLALSLVDDRRYSPVRANTHAPCAHVRACAHTRVGVGKHTVAHTRSQAQAHAHICSRAHVHSCARTCKHV